MQNQNWRMFNRAIAVATVTVLVASFTTLAAAQRLSGEERSAVFASAPRIQTSVKGVSVVAGPPKGFNALTATNRELLSYGLPQRPDKALDEKAYEHWEKGMMALQACSQRVQVQGKSTSPASQACQPNDVTAKPYSSRSMASSGAPTANVDAQGVECKDLFHRSRVGVERAGFEPSLRKHPLRGRSVV
jgi:hypothetical protein